MPWPQICPDILASGACPYGARCTYNHTVLSCEPCGFIARSQYDYKQHLDSRHHKSRAAQSGRSRALSSYCAICQEDVPDRFWEKHFSWPKHRQREAPAKHRSVLDEAEKDRNGVIVEGVTDLGFFDPMDIPSRWNGHTETLAAKVARPSEMRIRLVEVALASKAGSRPFNSGFTITSAGLGMITPNAPALVAFRFNENSIGRYDDRIEFTFEEPRYDTSRRFIITRTLQAIVGSRADHEALRPRELYNVSSYPRYPDAIEPGRLDVASGGTEVVPGVPPPSVQAVKYVAPLPRAEIPARLLDVFQGFSIGMSLRSQIAASRTFLPGILTNVTYVRHFKYLLWVEEHRTEADLARYDMEDVTLSKFNNYYYLGIPGLAEKRPSVLVGDRILFQHQGVPSSQWYEGHVHVVRQNEVGLCFHASFATGGWSPNTRYSVRFKLSRIVLRRQHQALDSALFDSALDNDRLFFPIMEHTVDGSGLVVKSSRTTLFNELIGRNPEQSEAVSEIVALPPGSVPFIIWGPPGTGKTVTVVEAILQVLQSNPNARILACAPSNSAADLIAERLSSTLSPDELFRMYAPSRSKESVSHRLSAYAFQAPEVQTNYTHCYGVPPMPRLQSYKVVVSTFVSSSMLSGVGMPRGHFHWVFVDEAGHATEPEACIPLKTLADDKTNVVLSGDPKQLGPIVRSAVARTLGLEKSFLERLMEREVYTTPGQGRKCIVKLTQNFRSHPSILKFPNDIFYGGDLLAFGPTAVTHAYLNSPFLPRPAASSFPVVFHSVIGKDEREASSPSFFNVDEVLQVKKYVQKLKDGRGKFRTTDADIGIIAPYHAQCLKLRAGMRNVADTVKVGSVEEFQGQERKVIIISTVRSSKEFVSFDLRHTLGFVANPRRFNVAVTRAKALLIIVGNPHVLGLDPLWRAFLQHIYLNGGWTGSSGIPWDLKEEDGTGGEEYGARVRRQAEMDMSELARKVQESMDEGEEGDVNVDRPWKDDE